MRRASHAEHTQRSELFWTTVLFPCSEKAELKRAQAAERALAGERPTRERAAATLAPDDEDLEWQQLMAASREAGCAAYQRN